MLRLTSRHYKDTLGSTDIPLHGDVRVPKPPRQPAASEALINIGAQYGTDVSREVGEMADELAEQSNSPEATPFHVGVALDRDLTIHPDARIV
jgi:hypothetical protein